MNIFLRTLKSTARASVVLFCFHSYAAAPTQVTPDLREVAQSVQKIKALLPPGEELAGAYLRSYDQKTDSSPIVLQTGDDYLNSVSKSFAFGDIQHAGRQDLAVVVEDGPPAPDKDGYAAFGGRKTLVFFADASGALQLRDQNQGLVLNGDDGGAFGDPFVSLQITARGVIVLSNYGGSADRWGDSEKIQFRNGGLFLIGQTASAYNDLSMTGSSRDVNFLTGDVVITEMRGENKTNRVTRKKSSLKPLLSFAVAKSANAG